jgi:4-alpha-glucanotransferase
MKATLAMALHFHQPVGNFDHVIDGACDKCYIPFLKALRKYPSIKMTLHFTGCLLEWAEDKRPELIDHISELASSGQAEIMTGGFYEPILVSIPPKDRLSQIRMLSEYVKAKFGQDPRGAWVAERVWEPGLASVFSDAGVKYIILDDTHFLYGGVPKDDTYGYYVTEDNSKTVSVFPSDKVLRYHIPFKMPADCMGYIRSVSEKKKDPLFVYGDDGEKFGEWPGTHKWVFEEKWLENFFNEIVSNASWLRTAKLSECLDEKPPTGRVYLPTASYEEMLEWSLPAASQEYMEDVLGDIRSTGKEEYYKPFIRGGFWRNFFTKYPESNHMNKKMIYVSRKLDTVREKAPDHDLLSEAEKELFRGQCNCAYWHGVFGGLYLYHLRNSMYTHLIRAEALIDEIVHGGKGYCEALDLDLDADGKNEVVIENRDVSIVVSPSEGGVIKELDSKRYCQNFINSLSRKKEAYHRQILEKIARQAGSGQGGDVKTIHDGIQTADASLKDHMNYDRHGRHCFVDHFISADTGIDDLAACRYTEKGDFVKGVFSHELTGDDEAATLFMKRDGNVSGLPVVMEKTVSVSRKSSSVKVSYIIKNSGSSRVETVFAPELNITMPFADSDRYELFSGEAGKKYRLSDKADIPSSERIEIRDKGENPACDITIILGTRCLVWHFPVKTVSQSEKAYELNYQSSAIVARYPLALDPGETASMEISISVKQA